jgi:hypothetical protein
MKLSFKTFFLVSIIFSFTTNLIAQRYEWVKTISSNANIYVKDVEYENGEVVMAGFFQGTVAFGTTSFTSSPIAGFPSRDALDIFVAKYDTLGNFIWAKAFQNNDNSYGESVTVDANGDIYLLSTASRTLQFDTITTSSSYNGNFKVIAKLNSSGVVQWAKILHGLFDVNINQKFGPSESALEVDNNGVLYLTSRLQNELRYNSPTIILDGAKESFLLKINTANGQLLASKLLGNNSSNISVNVVHGMKVRSDGSVLLSGKFRNNITVDSISITIFNSFENLFVLKLDANLNAVWLKNSGGTGLLTDVRNSAIVEDQYGSIYVGGQFRDRLSFQGYLSRRVQGYHFYLLKLNPQGDFSNVKICYTDSTVTNNQYDGISDLKVDNNDNIYGVGSFTSSISVEGVVYQSLGVSDAIIMKLDTGLNLNWLQTGGGGSDDYGNRLAIDANENMYCGGSFFGLASFGTRTLNSTNSNTDGFLVKLNDCGRVTVPISAVGDTNFCDPGSVQLITQNRTGGGFQWLFNDNVIAGETFSSYLALDSGRYSLVVNQDGCLDTSRSINVKESLPPVNVTFNSTDTVCKNDSVILLQGGTPAGGYYTGSGVRENIFYPQLASVGNNEVRYVVNTGGCADSSASVIYVNALPQPSISGNFQPCEYANGLTYFTPQVTGNSYLWQTNGGTIMSGQGTNIVTVNWDSSGVGSITVIESNLNGCDSVQTKTVFIAGQQFSGAILGEDSICEYNNVQSYTITTPSIFYNWTINGGVVTAGQGTDSITVNWIHPSQGNISIRVFNNCGIDSLFTTSITIKSAPNSAIVGIDSICENTDSIVYQASNNLNNYQWKLFGSGQVNGSSSSSRISINWLNAGQKVLRLVETNANNCVDSIELPITILDLELTEITSTICSGASYFFAGHERFSSGIFVDSLSTSFGCDSIVRLNLTVLPVSRDSIVATICNSESFLFGANYLNNSGIYYDTISTILGCDSIVKLDLTVLPLADTLITASICEGRNLFLNGTAFFTPGTHYDTLVSATNCDSIIRIDLTILPTKRLVFNDTICSYESYFFEGVYYNQTISVYMDTFQVNGCDSSRLLNLVVLNAPQKTVFDTICQGEQYQYNGALITSTGVYYDTVPSTTGCDTLETLNLYVKPPITMVLNSDLCFGDSLFFAGLQRKNSGRYFDTLTTNLGCDSIVELNLTQLQQIRTSINDTICQGINYSFNGVLLNQAGNYKDTLLAHNGCDSILELALFVNPVIQDTTYATICLGDSILFGMNYLKNAGLYTYSTNTNNVCDSTLVLDLSIATEKRDSINTTICFGDSVLFGSTFYKGAGIYSDTMLSFNGCDSISFLNLTVSSPINDSVKVVNDSLIAIETGQNYQWFTCDTMFNLSPIAGANLRYYLATNRGFYAVEIDNNNCVVTSDCYQSNFSTSTERYIETASELKVYPNPTKGTVSILLPTATKRYLLSIIDINGRHVFSRTSELNGHRKEEINLESLPKGVYFLQISSKDSKYVEKIILE